MKQICSQIRGHNYFHGEKNYMNKKIIIIKKKNETNKNKLNELKEKLIKKKIK